MESSDALAIIAQVAVAIAGFSSVVVALDSRAIRSWSTFQRHNLRVLLQVSGLTIFFAIFPLVLFRAMDSPSAWNWALAVYAVVHLVDAGSFIRGMPKDLPTLNRVLPFVGVTLALLCLAVSWLGPSQAAEVLYLCQLMWHLGVSAMGFALLVTGEPQAGAS